MLSVCLLAACQYQPPCTPCDEYPAIFPDYVGVTVPISMAGQDAALFTFEMSDGRSFSETRERCGDTIWVTVSAWHEGADSGIEYRPFPIIVSPDTIDPYVAYRLIEPGYESWSRISIAQRQLTSYDESFIVTNKVNERGCINCHNFHSGNPNQMVFHSRAQQSCTVLRDGHHLEAIDFTRLTGGKQATYPAWHPNGRYIAFSSNTTHQCFMVSGEQPIEVYDTRSDIILYDTQRGTCLTDSLFNTEETWETFPSWSADGTTLYYCAADSVNRPADNRTRVHYRLMSRSFDPDSGRFTGEPEEIRLDTLNMQHHSVSHPRRCGDYLVFTLTDYGTFPIWHAEADLWMVDLRSGTLRRLAEINSNSADSYHSFSASGCWMVFGSRRIDGRYTRLYFTHFDGEGNFTKPFLLPQQEPEYNRLRLQSYNIPEFVRDRVPDIQSIKPQP